MGSEMCIRDSCPAELSRSRLKALILDGQLRCNGVSLTDPSASVKPDTTYELTLPPPVDAEPKPENIPLDIYYEDEHLIVLEKPAGMVVHPAPGSKDGTLVNALLYHCGDSLSGRDKAAECAGKCRRQRHSAL